VYDPLRRDLIAIGSPEIFTGSRTEFHYDVLARAMNGLDAPFSESLHLAVRRSLQKIAVSAEPDVHNPVAAQPFIHTTCNGLYFRQFRHTLILWGTRDLDRAQRRHYEIR
jgi:hypothetical protein